MNKLLLFFIGWEVFICLQMMVTRFFFSSFCKKEMQSFFRLKIEKIHSIMALFQMALLVFGIMTFVLSSSQNMQDALLKGALFGFVVYGVYDLTNFAVINNWSLRLLSVDWAWGCFVSSIMSGFMFWLSK